MSAMTEIQLSQSVFQIFKLRVSQYTIGSSYVKSIS